MTPRRPISVTIFDKTIPEPNSGCWIWLGATSGHGYGVIGRGGTTISASKASYEAFCGPVPDGMHVHHKCRNSFCCNPDHLEPLTPAANVARSSVPEILRAKHRSRTVCSRGHPLLPETTRYRVVAGYMNRECMICVNMAGVAWKARNAESYRARQKAWYNANKDAKAAKDKAKRESDPDREREIRRRIYQRRKALHLHESRLRKARQRNAPGTHTLTEIGEIRLLQKDRCAACKKKLRGRGHVDHIKPLILGGGNDRTNLQLLCASCNTSKGGKDPLIFMRKRGLLL